MTFKSADRIYETSTTTGTGAYTLDGAATGFQSFVSGIGAGNICSYFATDDVNWEVGIGTVSSGPNQLARTAVVASSNSGSAVNWGAGTKKLRCGLPAANAPRNAVEARASNTVLAQAEFGKTLICTGTWSQTFTAAATLGDGWHCVIKNDGTGTITLDPNGSETVNGATTLALAPGQGGLVVTDGSAFRLLYLTGNIGEYTESVVAVVSAGTSGQWADTTSLSLTAGDWDVSLTMFAQDQGATITVAEYGISSTSGNSSTGLVMGSNYSLLAKGYTANQAAGSIPSYRVSITGTTTYYAKSNLTYTGGPPVLWARLSARRWR